MVSDIVNENTLMPVGVAVACTVAIAGLVWKAARVLANNSEESQKAITAHSAASKELNDKLAHQFELFKVEIRAAIDSLKVDDHVTKSELREWVAELRAAIPEKNIPPFQSRKD